MARQRQDDPLKRTGARSVSQDDTAASEPAAGAPEGSFWRPRSKPGAGLHLVATPIGNLGDITLRALDVLAGADLVACEDTRVTGKLLRLLGITAQLTPYHDHNADAARPGLLARMEKGGSVALVSDAGTPLVSDPGFRLVAACRAKGIAVTAVPGASALLAAVQLSGLPADRFMFAGFLPNKAVARRAVLRALAEAPCALVFYDSPNRLADSLADMAAVFGERLVSVARELTKMHEEVVSGLPASLAARYAGKPPKGEIVVVVGPPSEGSVPTAQGVEERLRHEVAGGASIKDASALVAAETGLPRRDVYAQALRLFRTPNED